jgi:hypothetical protein
MKKIKKRYIVILLGLAAAFAGVYIVSMWSVTHGEKMSPYSINSENSSSRILLAVQKSAFKDEVLNSIAAACQGTDLYISVVDVDTLPEIKPDEWDKILIFSAIMMWRFYPAAEKFLKGRGDDGKIFMYNTSESTQMKYGNIDTLTTASVQPEKCADVLLSVIRGGQ